MKIGRHFALLVIAVLCASRPALGGDIEAVTKPSKDVTLSFVRPGRIAKVLVTDGQDVKAGQLLAQQDDAAEQARLEVLISELSLALAKFQREQDNRKYQEAKIRVARRGKGST